MRKTALLMVFGIAASLSAEPYSTIKLESQNVAEKKSVTTMQLSTTKIRVFSYSQGELNSLTSDDYLLFGYGTNYDLSVSMVTTSAPANTLTNYFDLTLTPDRLPVDGTFYWQAVQTNSADPTVLHVLGAGVMEVKRSPLTGGPGTLSLQQIVNWDSVQNVGDAPWLLKTEEPTVLPANDTTTTNFAQDVTIAGDFNPLTGSIYDLGLSGRPWGSLHVNTAQVSKIDSAIGIITTPSLYPESTANTIGESGTRYSGVFAENVDVGGQMYNDGINAISYAGTNVTWDADDGNIQTVTITDDVGIQIPSNLKVGATYMLLIQQDVTGSRLAVWADGFDWGDGVDAPTLTTTPGKEDIVTCIARSASKLYVVETIRGFTP